MHAFEVVLVIAWAWTLVTTLLNVRLIPRLRPVDQPRGEGPLPLVSIIVPARNEEQTIERTLRALLAQTYGAIEIIAVNDRSTDATGPILDSIAAGDRRLSVIHGEEPPDGWLGKPWALDQGSRRAHGDLLLFVDADITYAPNAVATMVDRLRARGIDMLSIAPRFEMHGLWEHIGITQLAVTAFMLVPTWLGNLTGFIELGIGGGPGNLVRRDAFESIGGYECLRNAVIDDIGMARQLRARGRRTEFVLGDDVATVRMYRGGREIIEGFTKNLFPIFGANFVFGGAALLLMLLFDVLPYALAVRGDTLAVIAVGLITASRVVLFARLRYSLVNAVFGLPLSALLWSWILIRSMWLIGAAGQLQWRGRSYGRNWTRFGRRR